MSTFDPRPPYSQDELRKLYPNNLQLQLVQILLRHGERSPVSPRFQNTLPPYWPYCSSAKKLTGVILGQNYESWDQLHYRRRLETFGLDDGPVVASGPNGEFDAICQPGELTDKGRETTLALGERLRHLYIDQLGFIPKLIADSDFIYLRATPLPRALESVQQAFWGLYPKSARTADFPPATILTRTPGDETLYPNDGNCRRLAQMARAFAQRTADRWNDTEDMAYLSKTLSKWMPDKKPVAVDSHPRLSGVMDTINSTLAHGPQTRLPKEFYDEKARDIIDKIGVEEWYSGYTESREYRMLGIGALVGDIVDRMTSNIERSGNDGLVEIGGEDGKLGVGRGGEKHIRFALSGCHDTTLAAALSSLGAFDGEKWPPYTSHIAFELFREKDAPSTDIDRVQKSPSGDGAEKKTTPKSQGWWQSLFGSTKTAVEQHDAAPQGIARKKMDELMDSERKKLDGYYHLDGDETFCTLEAFKEIADKFTPKHWKQDCRLNMDQPAFLPQPQPAGY